MPVDPDVSVVVGAYNAMPYLTRCVSSVLEQSIGRRRIELIAVDDGSTDGTAEELDRFAAGWPGMRVIHQENSGGPAGPRNVGIEHARGRYLFFLDADDYLGREALERMVAMADRNTSDIVVGRRVGAGGRGTPQTIFRSNQDSVDLVASGVWRILSAQKLFRRALVDRLGLRFPDMSIGQDQPFTGLAYLHANVVSVLSDYDCYYLVRREDEGNNTTRQRDIRDWLRCVEVMTQLVADHVPPGDERDALMVRHFNDEFRRLSFTERYLEATEEVREEAVERGKALVDAYYTPKVAARMPVDGKLRFHLISRGMVKELAELIRSCLDGGPAEDIVEGGRIYAAYPFFRDASVGIPDECYDVTNRRLRVEEVRWDRQRRPVLVLSGSRSVGDITILLTTTDGAWQRVPAERSADGSYTAVLRLDSVAGGGPLPYGAWRVSAEFWAYDTVVRVAAARRTAALRRRLWWRRGVPAVVAPRRGGTTLVLIAAPLLSTATARGAVAAVRRSVRWRR